MGSGADVIHETVDYLMKKGEKVGRFESPTLSSVVDRAFSEVASEIGEETRGAGSIQGARSDRRAVIHSILAALSESGTTASRFTANGSGLSSKDFDPAMVASVFNNLSAKTPKNHFTVGINDDVTGTSIEPGEEIDASPEGTVSCKFWGFGSDGTVSANKGAIKIIGDHTDLYTGDILFRRIQVGRLDRQPLEIQPSRVSEATISLDMPTVSRVTNRFMFPCYRHVDRPLSPAGPSFLPPTGYATILKRTFRAR